MSHVVFVRRQSPDWFSLSEDFRNGRNPSPDRYVPDHDIPGFPKNVTALIAEWNRRFRIDFFTFRATISTLSRENISNISNSVIFTYEKIAEAFSRMTEDGTYFYYHDDDDFFSSSITSVLDGVQTRADVVVTPLIRIGTENKTFCRNEANPAFVCGERRPHDFRFQTNNYGIRGGTRISLDGFQSMKDHVQASHYADANGLTDLVLSDIVSATVKTPGSASMLPCMLTDTGNITRIFDTFLWNCTRAGLPPSYDWLAHPLQKVARLAENVIRGRDYASLDEIVTA